MKCPYCGRELDYVDYWMVGNVKKGDIYICSNHEGFESKEELMENYELENDRELEKFLRDNNYENWEEVCCDSCTNYVSGHFYTIDSDGSLIDGYPC